MWYQYGPDCDIYLVTWFGRTKVGTLYPQYGMDVYGLDLSVGGRAATVKKQ